MQTLHHSAAAVIPACHSGRWCYKAHPTDMGRWCDDCRDGRDPSGPLPDWMGGTVPTPEPDAPREPRLPMADWIEVKAQELRLLNSDLASWLAEKIDAIAAECRVLDATTPDEFDARAEVMAIDHDDHDRYFTAEDYRRASHGF